MLFYNAFLYSPKQSKQDCGGFEDNWGYVIIIFLTFVDLCTFFFITEDGFL